MILLSNQIWIAVWLKNLAKINLDASNFKTASNFAVNFNLDSLNLIRNCLKLNWIIQIVKSLI